MASESALPDFPLIDKCEKCESREGFVVCPGCQRWLCRACLPADMYVCGLGDEPWCEECLSNEQIRRAAGEVC